MPLKTLPSPKPTNVPTALPKLPTNMPGTTRLVHLLPEASAPAVAGPPASYGHGPITSNYQDGPRSIIRLFRRRQLRLSATQAWCTPLRASIEP